MSIQQQMDNIGFSARTISVEHLKDLREDIEGPRREGEMDETFYREDLASFRFEVPAELPDARTIIVVARPQPALMVLAHHQGRVRPLTVPPTYADSAEVTAKALEALNDAAGPGSYRFVRAVLPLKTLAARSGLAMYGKNNIAYIPKFGSYHRLTAFFTDMPCEEDQWQDREVLAGCDSCQACVRECPTGAIPRERFLLRAEKCLTYLNEKEASIHFPAWLDPSAHNAMIGCMRCQKVCPYNRKVLDWTSLRGELSEEETALLLSGRWSGEEAKALEEKLKGMGLDLSVFPRNLVVLLEDRE
ncbi:MAG: epoxyqueuosine reductase [Methanomassiliicoccus sp.]|nr:epoxyqueuosine reductase [Methanomassiliicoccus sp.]